MRGLVDIFDLSSSPRSLLLGSPATTWGTKPKFGTPSARGTGSNNSAAFGGVHFTRSDGLYTPASQTHIALCSVDAIAGGGFDAVFATADIPTFGSVSLYFASSTFLSLNGGLSWTSATVFGGGMGVLATTSGAAGNSIWWNGVKKASTTGSAASTYSTSRMIFNGPRDLSTAQATKGTYILHMLFNRVLDDREIAAHSENLRRIASAQPRRLWVAPAAAGVTVALTGQSATATAGTVAPSRAVALTGVAATATAGTLAPSSSKALAGQAATAAAGTLAPARTVALSGIEATAAAGTVSAGTDKTVALTGQAATASAGTLTAARSVALSGQAATAAAGTVTASAGNNVTVALTGQAMTAQAGSVGHIRAVGLYGQAATATAGTLYAGDPPAAEVFASITARRLAGLQTQRRAPALSTSRRRSP